MATRQKITLAEINQMNKGALKSKFYLAWKNTPDVGMLQKVTTCYKILQEVLDEVKAIRTERGSMLKDIDKLKRGSSTRKGKN